MDKNQDCEIADTPSPGWQMMWSRQTPFIPDGARHQLVVRYPILAPFYPTLSPGVHIVCARLVPVAVVLFVTLTMDSVLPKFWNAIYRVLHDGAGVGLEDVFLYWTFLTMGSAVCIAFVVQLLFIRYVPGRCVVCNCSGRAFLRTEEEAASMRPPGHDTARQFVYICRDHKHRLPTGVRAWTR